MKIKAEKREALKRKQRKHMQSMSDQVRIPKPKRSSPKVNVKKK